MEYVYLWNIYIWNIMEYVYIYIYVQHKQENMIQPKILKNSE